MAQTARTGADSPAYGLDKLSLAKRRIHREAVWCAAAIVLITSLATGGVFLLFTRIWDL